jgi:signal transduction histidine kinase
MQMYGLGRTLRAMPETWRAAVTYLRRASRDVTRRDLLIGAGFVVFGFVELASHNPGQLASWLPVVAALSTITLRRRWPVLPLAAIAATVAVMELVIMLLPGVGHGGSGHASITFGLMFATFSLGIHGSRRELAIGAPLPLLLNGLINGLAGYPVIGGLIFTAAVMVAAPLFVGRLLRDRSRLVAELRRREVLLHADGQASEAAALAAEKLELSAQLQAILANGMDQLVMQVEVARQAPDHQRPSAVGAIEVMARRLLGELGQVLTSISPVADASQWTGEGLRAALERARTIAPASGRPRLVADRLPPEQHNGEIKAPVWAGARWDLWAAGAIFAALAFQTQSGSQPGMAKGLAVLACLVVAAPVAIAGRRALLATATSFACAAVFNISVLPLDRLFTALSLVFVLPLAVAALEDRRRALAGLGICLLGAFAIWGLSSFLGVTPIVVGAWWAGRMLRDRTRLAGVLANTNQRLALERESNDLRIVLEERAKMAREVHDVVGHSLTVIALQAGAARRLWERDRGKAEAALVTIARVAETGRLDLRRAGSLEAISAQSPHLLEIDKLVEQAHLAGLTVGVKVLGAKVQLDSSAELAAYRLVQEALTNVLKHVPKAKAEIRLSYLESGLEVAVHNATTGLPAAEPAIGRGLRGMQERVTACGGTLRWGPNPDGDFEVRAWFPSQVGAN